MARPNVGLGHEMTRVRQRDVERIRVEARDVATVSRVQESGLTAEGAPKEPAVIVQMVNGHWWIVDAAVIRRMNDALEGKGLES